MKKLLCILLVLSFLSTLYPVFAAGFLPSANELFGQAMPSIAVILNREVDEQTETDDGMLYLFHNITKEDYDVLSKYFGGTGCTLESTSIDNGILTAIISKENCSLVFTYNSTDNTASMLYPSGSRPEDTKQAITTEAKLLPEYIHTFGIGMPSMNPVLQDKSKSKTFAEGTNLITYSEITEAEYDAFSRYLSTCNCILTDFNFDNDNAIATISHKGALFQLLYSVHDYTATIKYPDLSYIDDINYTDSENIEPLYPLSNKTFGALMPRIALCTDLVSTGIKVFDDGSWEESYNNFTDKEYAEFSSYLQEKKCSVIGYDVDASGVMTIQLEEEGVPFALVYDRPHALATVYYDAHSRPEPTPTPTPAPTPTPTPGPEPAKEVVIRYSENDCWNTARTYMETRRWNNSDSFKIYDHVATMDYSTGIYTFRIDYSAENKLGGSVRKYGFVMVDAGNNTVTNAWLD